MEEFGPIGERFVGRDDGAGSFIPMRDESEEEVALFAGDGGITNLVDDDQDRSEVTPLPAFGSVVLVFLELGNQIGHGGEKDSHAASARLDRQRDRQMGFTDTGRTEEDDVFLSADKIQIEKGHDLVPVQFRLEGEIELIDGFREGKPGKFEQSLYAPLLLLGDLFLQ